MLLRSITKHVQEQNWYAIGIDFFIVVVGVFIGMQVANWNDVQTFKEKETYLLMELKREIESAIIDTNKKISSIEQVVAAINRSVAFFEKGESCGNECWQVLVDFLTASQWQELDVDRTTYSEMRSLGLPRSRKIIDSIEAYLSQNELSANTAVDKPVYRSHVRGLLPLKVHDVYWLTCYAAVDGNETYILDCPKGVSDVVAQRSVQAIAQAPNILEQLTFWYSDLSPMPDALVVQNEAALKAIAEIDLELKARE